MSDASNMGTLESEGSFTIAGDVAIGKLAAFQLPRQSAWILKIVQAAVVCRSDSLKISQSNDTTTFTFEPNERVDIATLKHALLSPQVSGTPEVRHLAVGLRAVGFGDRRAFTLAFDRDAVRTFIGWNGSVLVERAEPLPKESRHAIHLGVAFPVEDQGRRLAGLAKSKGRATTEYSEVVQNGEVCPIPLYFDGLRIDNLRAPCSDRIDGQSVTLSVGWAPHQPQGGLMLLPLGLGEKTTQWKPTDRFTDERIFHIDGRVEQREVSSIAKIRYSYKIDHYGSKHRKFEFHSVKRFSEYSWVKDGVVCHREPSSMEASAVSFQIYLPADDLKTDISGLTIVTNSESEQRKDQARERLRFLMQNTLEALEGHLPKPFVRDTALAGGIAACLTLIAPFTLGKSLIGASIVVASMIGSASNKKQVMEDCKYQLRRAGDRLRFPEVGRGRGRY